MSERLLGAIVASHGDDKGLVMPPSIAPIQVVVVPIISKGDSEVLDAARKVVNDLKGKGIRVKLDDREIRPGQKYYDWEIKGVPLRVEIGPRDLANNSAMLASRLGDKNSSPLSNISESVTKKLDEIGSQMLANSQSHFNASVKELPNFNLEGNELIFDNPIDTSSVYEMAFDGSDAEAEMIERSTGLSFLGDSTTPYSKSLPCIITGKSTSRRIYLARTY
tara:strand:- start:63 stop:725 length:663 start_codon:yes stop_codon:yes gene_type:complete